jgi:two-component system OmpR family response regulator
MRILLVEDDQNLNRQISSALKEAGYVVETALDGEQGAFLGETSEFDAAVLDIGLPKIDGREVLSRWRRGKRSFPVLMLTARNSWWDKVECIDAGADDYLTKPFHLPELLARLRALIRRHVGQANPVLICGPVSLDTRTGDVIREGVPVSLTTSEKRLLQFLMHRAGRIIDRTGIMDHIYASDLDRDSNTVEVFVRRLRNKLGQDLIETVRGQGYRIRACPLDRDR